MKPADATPTISTGGTLPRIARRAAALTNLAFLYIAMGLTIVQGVVLVPLYLKSVPLPLYGAWLATGNVLAWIELVDPGLSDTLRQRVAFTYGKGDTGQLASVIGTGVLLSLGLSLAPLLAWPFSVGIPALVHLHGDDAATLVWAFRMGLVGTAFTMLCYGVTAANLGLQLSLATGFVYTFSTIIGIVSTVAMLHHGVGLAAIPLGLVLRSALLFVGNAGRLGFWCARHLPSRPRFDRKEFHAVMGLSAWNFTSRLGGTLLEKMDAFLVAHFISPLSAGVLGLTGRAFDPTRMATVSISAALSPGLSHLHGEGDLHRLSEITGLVVRITGWITAIAVGAIIALNGVFVTVWVGHRFFGGEPLTIALGAAVASSIFSATLNRLIFAVGGIRQSARASLVEAALRLPLQIVLLRVLGILATPLAATIAATLVSGWYLPTVLARLLREPTSVQLWRWFANALRVATYALVGVVLHLLLARLHVTWRWPTFLVAAATCGVTLALPVFALEPAIRERLLRMLRIR